VVRQGGGDGSSEHAALRGDKAGAQGGDGRLDDGRLMVSPAGSSPAVAQRATTARAPARASASDSGRAVGEGGGDEEVRGDGHGGGGVACGVCGRAEGRSRRPLGESEGSGSVSQRRQRMVKATAAERERVWKVRATYTSPRWASRAKLVWRWTTQFTRSSSWEDSTVRLFFRLDVKEEEAGGFDPVRMLSAILKFILHIICAVF
jgi:hypothetical protein